jgi:hypothetical protein
MKTLNEQLDRIKSMMGLINEQDDVYNNFINSNNFRNCRGIRLTSKSGEKGGSEGGEGVGWSRRAQKQLEKQMRKEEEAELKNFNKQNNLNLDMEYYTVLKDDTLKVKNYNATNRYNILFNEEGKPFTKNMTQKIVNDIQELFNAGSVWYFYWRDVFGGKTPSFMDLYKYIEGIGGKEKFKQLVDANYNIGEYKSRLISAVEAFETQLKSRFPFEKPTSATPFYFIWNEGKVRKIRYFNNYEEWNVSLQILKQEGNEPTGESTNGNASEGSVSFSSQPKKGVATPLLFK